MFTNPSFHSTRAPGAALVSRLPRAAAAGPVGVCPAVVHRAAALAPRLGLIASSALAFGFAGCATPATSASTSVPAALHTAAGERTAFSHFARGVQIYRCTAAQAAGAPPAWAFVAPQAELFAASASMAVLGTHGAGPFWQASDGSRVTGQVKSRADAPAAGAIPWLLLATTPNGQAGEMARVTSIQRINTVGGVAPAQGCGGAADVGKEARVPYTATYVYFVRA